MIRTTGSAQKSSNIYAICHPCAASIFLYFYKRSSLPLGLLLLFISVSVTRFGEIPPLWKIFKNLWKYIYGLFGFGPSFHDTLAQFVCFWANFHYCKWPNIENTTWSSGHTDLRLLKSSLTKKISLSRHMIRQTLAKQKLDRALINIPINITTVPLNKLNQPPWLIW